MFKVICKLWIEWNINDVRDFWPWPYLKIIILSCKQINGLDFVQRFSYAEQVPKLKKYGRIFDI